MTTRRVLALLTVLALVAVAATGAWMAGSRIASPAEVAARTAPPEPSPILVPVERRVLSSNVVTRGTARFGLPQPISIAPSVLKAAPGLITTLPRRNTQLDEGSVLLTASGRPVFVLEGKIPAYRDLVPGISGEDVGQLEQGLMRLGFDPGPLDKTYDAHTSAAVEQWYQTDGWEPVGPTIEQRANIRTLEQELALATKEKVAATDAAAAAARAVESARAKAEQATRAAAAEVEAKIVAQEKVVADLENAARAVEAAHATAEHRNKVAAVEVEAKLAAREALVASADQGPPLTLESARASADHAKKAAAAEIATKISDRALVVLDPRSTTTSRAAADAQLEVARAGAFVSQLQAELALQSAEAEVRLADEQLELVKAAAHAAQLEGEVAVQAARNAQKVAGREVELADEQVGVARVAAKATQLEAEAAIQAALDAQKIAEIEVKLAEDKAARLAADLELAKSKVGVQVPVDEIVFIPALPVRVEELSLLVGDAARGPVMSVTDNQLAIDASLTLDAAPLVRPGMPVAIDEQALGIKATGVVARVASTPGTHGVDGYHIYCEVHVKETTAPLEGFSVRLTIPIESTTGAVFTVPISALSLAADGTSRVQVQKKDALEYVVVQPGLAADGFVEVTPIGGTLEPGQLVVVGYETGEEKTAPQQ